MKTKRIRGKKKLVIMTAWQPWQMETFQGKPWYLHAHLCVKKCNYECNGKSGFVLARLVDQLDHHPVTLSKNGQTTMREIKLAERLVNMLAKAATRLLDLLLRAKALLVIKNI